MARRIRKGDTVIVIAGNDRDKRGRVLRVLPEANRCVVEGVNLRYKHLRKSQQHPQGGRIRREMPIHMSNVMPLDAEGKRARVKLVDGARVSKRSGQPIGGKE